MLQRNTKHVGSKTYHSVLVVERFRKDKKVRHRTIANISKFPPQVITAINAALKGGAFAPALVSKDNISLASGKNFGGLWAIKKIVQMDLFDNELVEVADANVRYILRRNPLRADEIKNNRDDKIQKVEQFCATLNAKLGCHPRSQEKTALKALEEKIGRLRLTKMMRAHLDGRTLTKDGVVIKEVSRLDGRLSDQD